MKELSLADYGLLTVEEAALRRDPPVAARTVQRWIENGDLPAVIIGSGRYRRYLIPTKLLDAFEPARPGAPEGNQFAKKKRGKKKS